MTQYLELKIQVNTLYTEFVADILADNGCKEIILSEEYYSGDLKTLDTNYIKAYIANLEGANDTVISLQKNLKDNHDLLLQQDIQPEALGTWELIISSVDDTDWAESWKQYWHPQRIGNHIIICPSWEQFDDIKDKDIIINLDPGGAFGTGTHPTTRLCLMAMEKYFNENPDLQSIFDVGTGSGILAIAAAKLGAKNILGIDIDPVAVEVAKQNAILNSVDNLCTFKMDSIKHVKEEYDLVLVNILAKVIVSMVEEIKHVTKRGHRIILSGLIASKIDTVTQPLEEIGINILEISYEDEWAAITAQRI